MGERMSFRIVAVNEGIVTSEVGLGKAKGW